MTIANFKTTMIAKAKKRGGIWENFGQVELNKLKDKHDYFGKRYSHDEKDKFIIRKLDELNEWCMTVKYFELAQL